MFIFVLLKPCQNMNSCLVVRVISSHLQFYSSQFILRFSFTYEQLIKQGPNPANSCAAQYFISKSSKTIDTKSVQKCIFTENTEKKIDRKLN